MRYRPSCGSPPPRSPDRTWPSPENANTPTGRCSTTCASRASCSRCGGAGTVIEEPCQTCQGEGRRRTVKRYRVNVPAGVREGSRIRLAGKGGPAVERNLGAFAYGLSG